MSERITIELKPFQVRTLMSLAYNEWYRQAKAVREGKIEKALISPQEHLVAELKEVWILLKDKV